MSKESAARRLARFVVNLRYEDLTPDAVFHAKRCTLDTLGVQLRGATLPWVQPAYIYAKSVGGDGAATISYHGNRVHAAYAAYANSAFSYSCELQHHGRQDSAHVGVIVVPVVQALGENLGSSGKEIMTAMVAGYEAAGQVGGEFSKAEYPRFRITKERHFHTQGMVGVFGATAAAGKLLKLSEEQQMHAFGIAASHASGILEYDQSGGEVKRIHGAIGARGGIQAAMLARAGMTGPLTVFEGRHGFYAAFGGSQPANPEQLFTEIANPYAITRCRYRIYPTIGTCHSPLDIICDLLKQHPFKHTDVAGIRVGVYERGAMHVGTIKHPHDVISAQASMAYSAGTRLVKGSNSLEVYLDPKLWTDPEILAIADKVNTYGITKPGFPRYTHVEIKLKDGKVLTGEADHTRGSDKDPFSDDIMAEKFRTLAQVMLPRERVEAIMQAVNSLETLKSVSELTPLLLK